jgi:TolA-binding protein
MKNFKLLSLAVLLTVMIGRANADQQTDIQQLKAQLQQMQENFDRVQREQRAQIEALTKKLESLTQETPKVTKAAATNAPPKTEDQKNLEQELAAELGPQTNAAPATAASKSTWTPSQPIPVMRAGNTYMNISFDALMDAGWSTAHDPSAQLQLGDHDPIKRGFSMRNAEIAVDGAVDPYFKGFGNIVFKLDKNNETSVELEEAFLQSTSLPHNLQLKAGQFFAAFGRQNPQHPHQWQFVDQPIILTRAFGPDGLRNLGVQLSYLLPTKFYTEATLGILDGQGGTGFSFRNPGEPDASGVDRIHGRATFDHALAGPQDLVYVPRLASSFDLSDEQVIVVGASGAFGPNQTGAHNRTEIYGADVYWKWKSPNAQEGFPFVSWQTEGLYQRYGAAADPTAPGGALPSQNLRDYGFYSQIMYGFKPHWVTGARGEYATGNSSAFDAMDPFRGDRYRVSPVITWYPSEFSKIRLQYNYDHGEFFGTDHSVWMQVEFLLGAHGAHKF